jgi:hypothetical protein
MTFAGKNRGSCPAIPGCTGPDESIIFVKGNIAINARFAAATCVEPAETGFPDAGAAPFFLETEFAPTEGTLPFCAAAAFGEPFRAAGAVCFSFFLLKTLITIKAMIEPTNTKTIARVNPLLVKKLPPVSSFCTALNLSLAVSPITPSANLTAIRADIVIFLLLMLT